MSLYRVGGALFDTLFVAPARRQSRFGARQTNAVALKVGQRHVLTTLECGVAGEAGSAAASRRRFVCVRGRRSRAVRRDCVNLQVWNERHSRLERLIGSAEPVQALLSAALGPSTIAVDVSRTVMRCHTRMAQRCRSAARLRSAVLCRRNRDKWRSRLRWAGDRLWCDCRQARRHRCHGHRAADGREQGCRRGRHWRGSRSGGCGGSCLAVCATGTGG